MEATIGKKDKILDAAAQLIVENGLQCSMAAIAERAGVATGSLYNYFPSKRAMVLGVYVRVGEQMSRAVVVEHADEVSHEGRIKGYIANYIEFIAVDAERAKLFEYLDNSPELSLTDIAATFSGFVDYTRRLFEGARAAGVVREGRAYLLGSFVRGAIRHTIKRRRLDPTPIDESEYAWIADMCWKAVARD
jgi:AcrR family transcriptional regulator